MQPSNLRRCAPSINDHQEPPTMQAVPRRKMRGVYSAVLMLSAIALAPLATAEQVTITAEYKGDASGRFDNTTPQAGFCGQWPTHCSGVETVGLPIRYMKQSKTYAPDVRDEYYVKLPGRRTVYVQGPVSGESYPMTFEIVGVSQRVHEPTFSNPVYTRAIQGGCSYAITYSLVGQWTMYLWNVKNPALPTPCYSRGHEAKFGQEFVTYVENMAVSYRLTMPSPLAMKPGIYEGGETYSVGQGMDFDFGNGVTQLNTNSLTINFRLDVQHAFVIDFPPGSERAVLEPPGGWMNWLSRGQPPQRLYRDLLFQIWSSGPFSAYKLCQYPVGDRCGIRNAANHEVPVRVGVSLPGTIRQNGNEVRKLELPTGRGSALSFAAMAPVFNRSGQLNFEVEREHVKDMLNHAGSTYRGDVTVVFDAEM